MTTLSPVVRSTSSSHPPSEARAASADVFSIQSENNDDDGRGFLTLDGLLRRPESCGLVMVHGAAAVLDSVAAHASRRARGAGRAVICAGRGPTDDAIRDLCAQVCGSPATDPYAAADAIARGLVGTVAIVLDHTPSAWGAAVVDALASNLRSDSEGAPLVVVLTKASSRSHGALTVRGALGPEESRVFWEAIAADAARTISPKFTRIDALERWWSAARATREGTTLDGAELSPSAKVLLARLALSQRAWHPSDLTRIGAATARDELFAAGAIEVGVRDQSVSVAPGWESAVHATSADATAVAEVLERGVSPLHGEARHDGDPWAVLRAAELHAQIGDDTRAEAAATRAILAVADADARSDFWQRWQKAQASLPSDPTARRLLRSAELALRVGDADRALDLARAATSTAGSTYETALLLGRATAARGDLTTATLAITRAMDYAADAGARARAAVELAQVHYTTGQIDDARRLAGEALETATDPTTRLNGRNVLGKILLDNARWAEAEAHFATDAWEAACSNDALSELRARLNRAIALMSGDRPDEARTMLASVLADGETQGQLRAVSFALANLSIIALWKHEYTDALSLSERSIVFARRLGDKVLLAHLITNLAELRLFFGLVAEAEQALAFGRKACGAVVASKLASHFSLAAARIHLARSRTLEAAAEIRTAIGTAEKSPAGGHLGRCHRIAARIALEDGDLTRVAEVMEKVRQTSTNTKDRSEAALLEALFAQAEGEPYADHASEALGLAGQSDNRMVAIEALMLLCQAAHAQGDIASSRAHLGQAIALRNRIADTLPDELHRRFISVRELAQVPKLEALLSNHSSHDSQRGLERGENGSSPATLRNMGAASRSAEPDEPAEPNSLHPPPRAASVPPGASRKLVGRDPTIVTLLSAIQKVGPADATVLIFGESGTGKELVAEAIHQASQRRGAPLVKVNCAALVETLLISELFGHEKGAFTGAVARRRGRFEMAEGGTLFLDEIGDISPRTQVALLRVLQEKTFERVGGVSPIRANVRVVCATHRDLKAMVARGEFREDLYFRLTGVVLEVPALRQRPGDLPLIAEAILARIGAERATPPKRLAPAALTALARHKWPGNVRELENALRAASLFAEGDAIELSDLVANVDSLRGVGLETPTSAPAARRSAAGEPGRGSGFAGANGSGSEPQISTGTNAAEEEDDDSEPGGPAPQPSIHAQPGDASDPTEVAYVHIRSGISLHDLKRNIERECIQRALNESKGNITRAAALLGMKRPRLSQLVKQYGFGGDSEDET